MPKNEFLSCFSKTTCIYSKVLHLNVLLTQGAEHYILLSPRKLSQASRRALGPTGKKPLLRRRRFDKTVMRRNNQIES